MTSRSRASRRAAARDAERGRGPRRWLWPAVAAVIVLAAVVAIVLSQGSSGGSSARPSGSPAASLAPGSGPTVRGSGLTVLANPGNDASVGAAIPEVEGTSFDGSPVAIARDGRPKVLLFLAHWCSHCQAEVPVVQDWLDAGGGPDDVDLISVATAIDPTLPNHPPEAWLEREGWTVPVIVDPAGTVADAYGLSAFPFWVFVDADGTVAARRTGELSIADLEGLIDGLRAP